MKSQLKKKVSNFKNNKGKFIYVNSRRNKPIKKNSFFFEAVHGDTVNGHIFYLIKEVANRSANAIINVSLRDTDNIESFIPINLLNRINFVSHLSHEYYECLATSEYLINDTTFYPFFNKRPGQKYFIVWHGTPLKYMGKDLPNLMSISNVQRNFYMADKIYVNNKKTMDILARTHHLNNVYNGKFVVGPSPRNSILFDLNKREEIKERFNLQGKRVIVYMPTWRGKIGKVSKNNEIMKTITHLENHLEDDIVLFVKLHPFDKTIIPDEFTKVKPYPNSVESYEFLTCTDALITDYSSIMYDYLNLKKPVILYTYDLEEYLDNRGVYDDINEYPFINVDNIEDLTKRINSVDHLNSQVDYSKMIEEFNKFDYIDGTKDILENMINGTVSESIQEYNLHNGKETVLIVSGGFWNNGITTALINTLENIDTDEKNYICFFEKEKVKKEHYFRLLNLPENVHFYPITGEINGNFTDRLLLKQYLWNEKFSPKNIEKQLSRIYREEFSRLFGDLKVDWFIHYTGFERKSAEMMRHIDCKKAIWVHTDMFAEFEAKRNFSKKIIFGAYKKADKIVLVHRNLKENLTKNIKGISDKIVTVNNFLGEKRTRKLAEENVLTSLAKVNVDYSFNDNVGLNLVNSDGKIVEKKAQNVYKEQVELTKFIDDSVSLFINKNNLKNKLNEDQKNKLLLSLNNSVSQTFKNLLLEEELIEKFPNLFKSNFSLIQDYMSNQDCYIDNYSVALYNEFRVSKTKMLEAILNPNITVYMNIGRYDYQKGHDKLIKAFEETYKENSNIFLILICPHGPLKRETIGWVRESIAKENIVILGGISNPYPLLGLVDAFVLSSNYEGLGLVVYEALALNRAVITVNLKETIEYLEEGNAIIVDNSVEGLIKGFETHLNNKTTFKPFNFEKYRIKSIKEFNNVIN